MCRPERTRPSSAPASTWGGRSGKAAGRLLPVAFQTLPEEPDDRSPGAVRHLGLVARAQEAVPYAGIDRVVVVLPILLHRGRHVRQSRIDPRVVLRVDAEPPRADPC